jgi:hypothetical protein
MPAPGLSCFACCPPIRPADYDHARDRGSWRRMFSDNRAAFLAGQLPDRVQIGFSCPGLGFLDASGSQVGCLLHPARNQGRDLREPTGYRDKCARESCPQSRAYAALPGDARAALMALCQGMDPFTFSSREQNPVMRLLAFGPEVATAAASLAIYNIDQMAAMAWLQEAGPSHGWLLARLLDERGPGLLNAPGLSALLREQAKGIAKRLGPAPPLDQGQPLYELCDEWEARFWRGFSGRHKARPAELQAWRVFVGY